MEPNELNEPKELNELNELDDSQLEDISGGSSEYDWKWYMVCDKCGTQGPYKDRISLFNRIGAHRAAYPKHHVTYAIK